MQPCSARARLLFVERRGLFLKEARRKGWGYSKGERRGKGAFVGGWVAKVCSHRLHAKLAQKTLGVFPAILPSLVQLTLPAPTLYLTAYNYSLQVQFTATVLYYCTARPELYHCSYSDGTELYHCNYTDSSNHLYTKGDIKQTQRWLMLRNASCFQDVAALCPHHMCMSLLASEQVGIEQVRIKALKAQIAALKAQIAALKAQIAACMQHLRQEFIDEMGWQKSVP